jgi:hypothetical protein
VIPTWKLVALYASTLAEETEDDALSGEGVPLNRGWSAERAQRFGYVRHQKLLTLRRLLADRLGCSPDDLPKEAP